MNGTTNKDRTNYFETLPANQLDLGLFLEADRMRALAVNQANLDNQRNAVQEEKRMGNDNQPYGKTFETDVDELPSTTSPTSTPSSAPWRTSTPPPCRTCRRSSNATMLPTTRC